jgi:hypothetical protein
VVVFKLSLEPQSEAQVAPLVLPQGLLKPEQAVILHCRWAPVKWATVALFMSLLASQLMRLALVVLFECEVEHRLLVIAGTW